MGLTLVEMGLTVGLFLLGLLGTILGYFGSKAMDRIERLEGALLEELLVAEREYEDHVPIGQILSDVATSPAARDALAAIAERVKTRLDPKPPEAA